jgi:hypothetical protein
MELTSKQKEYIDQHIGSMEINSDNIGEIHEEIYELMIDNYIINLEQYSDDEFESMDESYNNMVWDYIESKIV